MKQNINESTRHLKFRYISILTNLLRTHTHTHTLFIIYRMLFSSFEKGSNGQNHFLSDSHHPIKKFPSKIFHPTRMISPLVLWHFLENAEHGIYIHIYIYIYIYIYISLICKLYIQCILIYRIVQRISKKDVLQHICTLSQLLNVSNNQA